MSLALFAKDVIKVSGYSVLFFILCSSPSHFRF